MARGNGAPLFDYREYVGRYVEVLVRVDRDMLERLAHLLLFTWQRQRTVFLCGNGGNAAAASHLVTDLTRLTAPDEGPRLKAVALGDNAPGLTAVSNDVAYEDVFVEQLRTFCEPEDVVMGLSTSGSSPNVLRAIEYATELGATTVGVTGLQGEALRSRVDHALVVPSTSIQQLEDATMFVGHVLCLRLRDLIAERCREDRATAAIREASA